MKINVWRYFGQKDFNTAGHIEFVMRENDVAYSSQLVGVGSISRGARYSTRGQSLNTSLEHIADRMAINPIENELHSGSRGESLLERNQHFPLEIMAQTGYITDETRIAQKSISQRLSPDQVTFFEVTQAMRQNELEAKYGKIPENARREPYSKMVSDYFGAFADSVPETNPLFDLKVASTWLISGQPRAKELKLALENDKMTTPIDRKKFKFVWEVGRAAQTEDHGFEEGLRAAVYFAVRELIMSGGRLEDAFVFGHSLDRTHTALYMKKYGMKIYSGYAGSPDEAALVVPLSRLLDRLPLDMFSSAVQQLVKDSNGKLTPIQAMQLSLEAKMQGRRRLSSQSDGVKVLVRDFSGLSRSLVKMIGEKKLGLEADDAKKAAADSPSFPMPESIDRIVKVAKDEASPYVVHLDGTRDKNGQIIEFRDFLISTRSINVTAGDHNSENIDQVQLLKIAYTDVVQRLRELGVVDPKTWLVQHQIRFAVSGRWGVISAIGQIEGAMTWFVHRPELYAMNPSFFMTSKSTIRSELNYQSVSLSADVVASICAKGPDIGSVQLDKEDYLVLPELQ